jgi:hypothetical protein
MAWLNELGISVPHKMQLKQSPAESGPSPANHHGLAHPFRMPLLFYCGKKYIQVDMRDSSHQFYFTIPSQLF